MSEWTYQIFNESNRWQWILYGQQTIQPNTWWYTRRQAADHLRKFLEDCGMGMEE